MQTTNRTMATQINHLWITNDKLETMLNEWKKSLSEIDNPREFNEKLTQKFGAYCLDQELRFPVISKLLDQIQEIDSLFGSWLLNCNFLRVINGVPKNITVVNSPRTYKRSTQIVEEIQKIKSKILDSIEPNVKMTKGFMLTKASVSCDLSPSSKNRMTQVFSQLIAEGKMGKEGTRGNSVVYWIIH